MTLCYLSRNLPAGDPFFASVGLPDPGGEKRREREKEPAFPQGWVGEKEQARWEKEKGDWEEKQKEKEKEKEIKIRLDRESRIFLCLNGALQHIQVDPVSSWLRDNRTGRHPVIVHANGRSDRWLDETPEGRSIGGRIREFYGEIPGSSGSP